MSSPSIPISGSPHLKTRILLVTAAILFAFIAAGLGAFWLCTFFGTTDLRSVNSDGYAELIWLRREFHLTDEQFQRIQALHAAYAAKCDLMCQRIMKANAALAAAISRNKRVTPEIQEAMDEVARVQQDCQQSMLAHVYEVSEQMDPSSAEKYLQMMKQRIIQPGLPSNTAVSR
jgi:heavy-metal resistance protein